MDIYKNLEKIGGFEWDEGNIAKNIDKHGISNFETEEVFFGQNLVLFDEKHSQREERFYLLGQTDNQEVLFVVFTVRNDLVRVISSRIANQKERAIYKKYLNDEKRNSKI
jgi:uncharacterized protein